MLFIPFSCRSRTDNIAHPPVRTYSPSRKIISVFTAVMLFLLSAAAFGAADAAALASVPTGTPEFSMDVSRDSAASGDMITVSLYCDNRSSATLTSFQGILDFDGSLFEFIKAETSDNFVIYPNNQTITVDTKGASHDTVGFTFSDTTNTILTPRSGASKGYFLKVYFEVDARDSASYSFKCSIIDCYSGTEDDGSLYKFCDSSHPIEFSSHRIFVAGRTTTTTTITTTTVSTSSTTSTATTSPASLSGENRLRSLTVSQGTLTPQFSPDTIAYTLEVEYSCSSLRISADPYDNTVKAVSGYGVKDLQVGVNTFNINVIAQNGAHRHARAGGQLRQRHDSRFRDRYHHRSARRRGGNHDHL